MHKVSIVFLLAFLVGCGGQNARVRPVENDVAQTLKLVATTLGQIQEIVIEANRRGQVSDASLREILEVTLKISQAGKEATALVRDAVKLKAERPGMIQILKTLSQRIEVIASGPVANIQNAETRKKVEAAFALVNLSLSIVESSLR